MPKKENKGNTQNQQNRSRNGGDGGNAYFRRLFADAVTVLCEGVPGPKGSVSDHWRLAEKQMRSFLSRHGVADAKYHVPTSWRDIVLIGLLRKGETYKDASDLLDLLEDDNNPADLTKESNKSGQEGILDNAQDLLTGGIQNVGANLKDGATDLFNRIFKRNG